jgi:GNAT superfamily N-acetyltransferase
MVRVESVSEIQETIAHIKNFKKRYYTNLFPDLIKLDYWVRKGMFFIADFDETSIFFKKNDSFYNVYYSSTSLENLQKALSDFKEFRSNDLFVFDVVGEKSKMTDIVNVFTSNGFHLYTSLVRMSRFVENIHEQIQTNEIRFANHDDGQVIFRLLFKHFDKYAEQLPSFDDIQKWIIINHVLLYVENNTILGFLIYDIVGVTSYLRYWFVHAEHRDKRVGSKLLKSFFYECRNTKRQHFWVIENNENAVKRYLHYGFKKETIIDYVFINDDRKYEGESIRNISGDPS